MPVPLTLRTEAQLTEVFSSVQGEGMLIGCRQIFIRFAHCNLKCRYCDTSFEKVSSCRVEDAPGSSNFRTLANPVSFETLDAILADWIEKAPEMHHSISLTGGEPLVQGDLLADWAPRLADMLPLYLETNGTLPEPLVPILPHLSWISMDIKLSSATGTPTPWQEHCNFLAHARQTNCQVKVVVTEETPLREVEAVARMLSETAPEVPLILQPVTRKGKVSVPGDLLLQFQSAAVRNHAIVRVIPQTHAFMHLP